MSSTDRGGQTIAADQFEFTERLALRSDLCYTFGVDIASAWYASGTFWTGAGAVAAVLGAVVGAWVTLIVGLPRRRLLYQLRAVAPLLTTPVNQPGDVELLYRGTRLTDPRALTIELTGRGRKDISNDAYNGGQPLQLDVGVHIVEVLQITSEPKTLPPPDVSADETCLKIGPSLIGRRHKIILTVLTDAGSPSLSCKSPLIDVQVRRRADESALEDAAVPWAVPWLLALLVLLLVALFLAITAKAWAAAAAMAAAILLLATATLLGISGIRNRGRLRMFRS